MQRTRRLLPDSQHTQRWEDTPEAKKYERWFAGSERRLRLLKMATIMGAVLLALMCAAVVMFREAAPIVAGVALAFAFIVWGVTMAWEIKEMR